MPRLQALGENLYSLSGLYENGYTLAPFFAHQFLEQADN